jgi:choline dehydrogenase
LIAVTVAINNGTDSLDTETNAQNLLNNVGLWFTNPSQSPLSSNVPETIGFFKSDNWALESQDLQYIMAPVQFIKDNTIHFPDKVAISLGVSLMRPISAGYVKLNTTNPEDPPLINPKYLDRDYDLDRIVEGLKKARQVLQQPAIRPFWTEELVPGANVQTDEQWKQYVRDYHFSGCTYCSCY